MILRSILIFHVLFFSAGSIHAAPKFLKPLLDFEVKESVSAIAFTADEALVVVALAKDDGSLLELREVTSGKLIQRFHSPDNPSEELEFDFRQRLLAHSGQKRIELWNLEEIETKTTPYEISRYRIWQQETKTSGEMKFSLKSAKLRWIEGKELKEIPIKPPFIESKVWTGTESGELDNFEFDPDEKILALTEKGNTQIRILQPWQNQIRPSLDYHHFPVADMFFPDKDQIISLDREQNLAWGEITSRSCLLYTSDAADE